MSDRKLVKGALMIGDREIMAWLPEDWAQCLDEKFILVTSVDNSIMGFNLGYVMNVREVADEEWNGWITRLELAKKQQADYISKAVEDAKTQTK